MSLLRPHYYVDNVVAIDVQSLVRAGIKAVLLDRDNTIVPRDTKVCPPAAKQWIEELKEAGIIVMFISNNWAKNVRIEAEKFGTQWISKALKPLPFVYWIALRRLGVSRKDTVMIGDQLFTDILGAKLAGIPSILVAPQTETDLFHTVQLRKLEQIVLKHKKPCSHIEFIR